MSYSTSLYGLRTLALDVGAGDLASHTPSKSLSLPPSLGFLASSIFKYRPFEPRTASKAYIRAFLPTLLPSSFSAFFMPCFSRKAT